MGAQFFHATRPGLDHTFIIDGQSYSHRDPDIHTLEARTSLSMTLRYRIHERFSVGAHYDPRLRHGGPVANLVALTETDKRPALVLGISADRIGLPSGRAWYANISKDLQPLTGWPIAPYAGFAYSTYNRRFRPIGGARVGLHRNLSSLVIYDGVCAHPVLNWGQGRNVFALILVRGRHPGFGYNLSF
jgi:hypothetical protein